MQKVAAKIVMVYTSLSGFCPLSAGSDYIEASRVIVFTGDSVQHVSIQIIDDGISEPPETLSGLLSGADGTVIPPNVRLEPTRATAIIINTNGKLIIT